MSIEEKVNAALKFKAELFDQELEQLCREHGIILMTFGAALYSDSLECGYTFGGGMSAIDNQGEYFKELHPKIKEAVEKWYKEVIYDKQ